MDTFSEIARLTPEVNDGDHIQGDRSSARIALVEYGDYQCPFTARATHMVRELQEQLGGRILFVYRHFPLTDFHPNAEGAAEAAEAAGAQGRFWEMHDLLFRSQGRLDAPYLRRYGEALGLDMDRFTHDLGTHEYAARVRDDYQSGERSGVESTPTFYVNGLRYDGPNETAALLRAIEAVGEGQAAEMG